MKLIDENGKFKQFLFLSRYKYNHFKTSNLDNFSIFENYHKNKK